MRKTKKHLKDRPHMAICGRETDELTKDIKACDCKTCLRLASVAELDPALAAGKRLVKPAPDLEIRKVEAPAEVERQIEAFNIPVPAELLLEQKKFALCKPLLSIVVYCEKCLPENLRGAADTLLGMKLARYYVDPIRRHYLCVAPPGSLCECLQ